MSHVRREEASSEPRSVSLIMPNTCAFSLPSRRLPRSGRCGRRSVKPSAHPPLLRTPSHAPVWRARSYLPRLIGYARSPDRRSADRASRLGSLPSFRFGERDGSGEALADAPRCGDSCYSRLPDLASRLLPGSSFPRTLCCGPGCHEFSQERSQRSSMPNTCRNQGPGPARRSLVFMQVSGPGPLPAGICALHVLSAAASGRSNEKMRQWCTHPLLALMLPL